jgi:hypothetical protein
VDAGDLVTLRCSEETLRALARGLTRFGPAKGAPDWLVSGVWLCTDKVSYIATASVDVLRDGYVARPLRIDPADEFGANVEAELPDISARLVAQGNGFELPEVGQSLSPPQSLRDWPRDDCSAAVLIRVSIGASHVHRTACALLFGSDRGRSLLVGTDPATMAMVVSEDEAMIERYRAACEVLPVSDYLGSSTS